jgi:hypothetical protein
VKDLFGVPQSTRFEKRRGDSSLRLRITKEYGPANNNRSEVMSSLI